MFPFETDLYEERKPAGGTITSGLESYFLGAKLVVTKNTKPQAGVFPGALPRGIPTVGHRRGPLFRVCL